MPQKTKNHKDQVVKPIQLLKNSYQKNWKIDISQ
jgi:hypothetical protein